MARTRTVTGKTETETARPTSETPAADTIAPTTRTRAAELREIAVAEIATNGGNPRTLFDLDGEAGLKELAESIKAQGLLQPITVRPNPDADATPPYVLVAGERRLRAVRDVLTWPTITAIVRRDFAAATALEATVLENLQRRDLHPMEEARGLGQLRAKHGYTPEQIARKTGRSAAWVKERLKLCALPARAQDAYLRAARGRLTLQGMLSLHEYTRGGKDDKGFPALIAALVEDMEKGINPDGHLGTLAVNHGGIVKRLTHWGHDAGGTWGGHYFDSKDVCRRCPFGAYRPGYYDGEGYCLLPAHYAELQAKGKARYEEAEAERERKRHEDPAYAKAEMDRQIEQLSRDKTAAQKAAETRKRHQQQKADYHPTVRAIERAIDLIANVDGSTDLAVFCAYTLTPQHADREAIAQVIKRHGLKGFPSPAPTPSAPQIERLRRIEPVALLRYTLEALLLTQAMRARDYDPGRTPPDPVLALYLKGQALPASSRFDAATEVAGEAEASGLGASSAHDEPQRAAQVP